MAVFPTVEANKLLDATFSKADYVGANTGSQLRLCTAAPTDSAAGTLVAGGSYAHQALPFGTSASARSIANSGAASFTGMPAATVTHVDIYDSTGTDRKAYGQLTTARTTVAGDTITFAIGSIVCSYT